MAPSTEHIKLILAKLEDVFSAYDEDCRQQERRRRERLEKASSQAALNPTLATGESTIPKVQQPQQSLPSPVPSGPTPMPTTPASAFCRRKQRRGLLGRLLRQCLPVRGAGGGGGSKIQVPLGWASAVTFNWRRQRSANSSAAASTSIGNADSSLNEIGKGASQLRLRKRLRKGLGVGHEPVVLIGRRARHSTILMARARRLRRSLPAKLRRQLEGFGDSQEEEAEDDEVSDVEINNPNVQDEGKMLAPPVCVPSSSVETNADLVESSITDESPARGTCIQDSEQASLVLATPQRRELDAEVRKIEEEIKNVRQQLEQPDSESPFAPTPPRPRQRLLITSSGLDPAEVAKLRQLCEIQSDRCVYQARFQFDPELHTSHVIIRESSSVPRVSERTLKYFQALVSGAWLLSFDWVSESLAAGSLLPESAFEIQGDLSCGVNHLGPARSRNGRARCPGPSRLLEQFCIAPVGEFVNMPTFALQTLVQQCGGQFAASPESLPRRQAARRLSVAVVDQDDAKFSESRCRSIAASGDIIVLNRDWLLDSISKFRVQQLHSSEYCIAPDCSVAMEIVTRQRIRVPSLDDI